MDLTRRTMMVGALAATAVVAGGGVAEAGTTEELEAGHATPRLVRQVTSLYRDKSTASVDRTMAHFARSPMFYTDATLGWYLPTWQSLRDVFQQYMPTWPKTARSYPTRLIGDERSAIVVFTDSPELFGHEIRIVAAVDFRDGKVIRQVDYWDGRHFGIEATNALRVPAEQYPPTYGENVVEDQSSPVVQAVAAKLVAGDTDGLFAADAVLEDLALRTQIVGRQAIEAYLKRAMLPYSKGTTIRHTVGSARGGGYEWIRRNAPVDHGIVAFELDEQRRITRLIATWDGAKLDDTAMTALLTQTLER
ncbi:hypothetical protein [Kutzneria chonburiensis]|uniref:SnoaL-like domain-containing protein n=1 Tax=Kutzneria chonburiensis TaxID=1483604 RepID=A0ABV6MRS9_9PSEU|nr:hypothetical protein [Kutzneria chonburiensis]